MNIMNALKILIQLINKYILSIMFRLMFPQNIIKIIIISITVIFELAY